MAGIKDERDKIWRMTSIFNSYQPLLFVVDSFDHLFSLVDQLEWWMRAGELDRRGGR